MDYMDPPCSMSPERPLNLITHSLFLVHKALRLNMVFIKPMYHNKLNISSFWVIWNGLCDNSVKRMAWESHSFYEELKQL